jgi:hypothetical protein
MSNDFNDPGSGGDQLPIRDLVGALLLVTVHEETAPIDTQYGPTTAIRADVAVLDGNHKSEVFADTLIFQRVLKAQLRESIGGKVLGRLELKPNKKGNDQFQLAAATEPEKDTGRKYLVWLASQEPVTVPDEPEMPF